MIKVNGTVIENGIIGVKKITIEQNHFPDGTLFIHPPTFVDGNLSFEWLYESDAELFTLICLRKHYSECNIILYLPYIPHARMDRVKSNEDVFTLKYFCEVINSLNFTAVVVRDAHSYVSLGLLDRVQEEKIEPYINRVLDIVDNGKTALFFPDEGAMKRYGSHDYGYPIGFAIKNRDWATGKILGLTLMNKENLIGRDVLIIDDICSRGGTFFYSAKALVEAGVNSINLYITHCENTIADGELFTCGMIKDIFTTESLVHTDRVANRVNYICI